MLPNILTVLRILLTCVFIVLILMGGLWPTILGTIVFMVAAWTDYYDGILARRHNLISNFGKLMDPIADKFLVISAFYLFAKISMIPVWMFLVIVVREIVVTLFRFWAKRGGNVLAAEKMGKYKTVLQAFTIWIILLFLVAQEYFAMRTDVVVVCRTIIYFFMVGVIGITLLSGLSCLWNNRKAVT